MSFGKSAVQETVERSEVGRGCGRERRVRGLEEAAGTLFPPQLGCVSYVTPCACCPPLLVQPAPHPLPLPLPLPLTLALPLQALDPQVAKQHRLLLSNMVSPHNFRIRFISSSIALSRTFHKTLPKLRTNRSDNKSLGPTNNV